MAVVGRVVVAVEVVEELVVAKVLIIVVVIVIEVEVIVIVVAVVVVPTK